MTPSIPMGHLIWYRTSPSSSSNADICSPTGSGRPMTSRIPAIIPSILESSSLSLLYMEPEISPESNMDLAASRSLALASSMAARLESNATAIASRALSFTSVDRTERGMDASFALFTSDTTSDISYRPDIARGMFILSQRCAWTARRTNPKKTLFLYHPIIGVFKPR